MLHEDVAELRAEHDELAETLRAFGRSVDLRVLRQDPERETLRVAACRVDESDGLVDEDLRLVADLFAVRLALQRVAQLEEPVVLALQLLGFLFLFFDLRPRGRALGLEDLNVVVVKRGEELLDLSGLRVRDRPDDVFLRDVALLPSACDQALGGLAVLRMDPALLRRRRRCCRFLDLGCALHSSLSSASAACNTVCRSRRCMSSASSFAS